MLPLIDDAHHPDTPQAIKDALTRIGNSIGDALPKGWGFGLLIFTFGEGGLMSWTSNAQREDMLNSMAEFLRKNGRTTL